MKKLILLCVCFIFVGIVNAQEWLEKDFYSQGSSHYILGSSDWEKELEDSKRIAVKNAILNFGTYTNIEINSSYIESITDKSSELFVEEIISGNTKIGKVYIENVNSKKRVKEGFFSDDVSYRTIVQLRIHSDDVRPYDVETITEDATNLLLNQAAKTKNVRDKEKQLAELLQRLEGKEKNLDSMLRKLEKKDIEVSELKEELRLQLAENRFSPIEKKKSKPTASGPLKLDSSQYDYPKMGFAYAPNGFNQACKITNSIGDWHCKGHWGFNKGSSETGVKAKSIHVAGTNVCVLTKDDRIKCFREPWKSEWKDEDGIIETPVISKEVVGISMGASSKVNGHAGGPFACAILKRNGSVQCWALRDGAQLYAPDLRDVVKVDSGWGHSCALISDGKVDCWGTGGEEKLSCTPYGLCDRPTKKAVRVSINQPAVDLTVGDYSSCVILRDGSVECFGMIGERWRDADLRVPSDLTDVAYLGVGRYNACAVSHTDKITCWGRYNGSKHEARIGAFSKGKLYGYDSVMCLHSGSNSSCWNYDGVYAGVSRTFDSWLRK